MYDRGWKGSVGEEREGACDGIADMSMMCLCYRVRVSCASVGATVPPPLVSSSTSFSSWNYHPPPKHETIFCRP